MAADDSTESNTTGARRKPKGRTVWQPANDLIPSTIPARSPSPADSGATAPNTYARVPANTFLNNTVTSITQQQPVRTASMNSYASQPPRQGPRLQNTNKTGLGGSANQWGGFGIPSAGGFGGLGGAPGLGQARPGQLSGFAQVMGGGSGQGPIDMSDFPSLSGGPRPQQPNSNASAGWNSSAIRQPPIQSQTQTQTVQPRAPSAAPSQQSVDQFDGQRSQPPPGERSGGGDDFPPLGGQLNGDGLGGVLNGLHGITAAEAGNRINGQPVQLPIREASSAGQTGQQISPNQQTQQQPPQTSQPPPPSSGIKKYADMSENEKWGLLGLLAAFEARRQTENGGQPDESLPPTLRSAIVMGHDLSSLGLDLDSPDPLYPTFTPFQAIGSSGSTFDFHERHMIPDFTLPTAYTVSNVPPVNTRMSAFSDGKFLSLPPPQSHDQALTNAETLFTIFYLNPRDVTQELAANELSTREWRWHKQLRQWLQKDTRDASTSSSLPLVDLTNGAPPGVQPIRTSASGEKGVYIFFDAMNWRRERRYLELDYESLDTTRVATPNGVANVQAGGGPPPPPMGRLQTGVDVGGQGGGVGSSQIPSA